MPSWLEYLVNIRKRSQPTLLVLTFRNSNPRIWWPTQPPNYPSDFQLHCTTSENVSGLTLPLQWKPDWCAKNGSILRYCNMHYRLEYIQLILSSFIIDISWHIWNLLLEEAEAHIWYSSCPEKSFLIDGRDISHSLFLCSFFMFYSVTLLNPTPSKLASSPPPLLRWCSSSKVHSPTEPSPQCALSAGLTVCLEWQTARYR